MSSNRYGRALDRNRGYRARFNSDRDREDEDRRHLGPRIRKTIVKRSFGNRPERGFRNRTYAQPQTKRFTLPIREPLPTKRIEIVRKGGRGEPVIIENGVEREEIKESGRKEAEATQLKVENLDAEVTNADLKVV
eukprot:TRINITY_DN7197_c0_g1_i17.p2 TRINITY_DN7197_c0_g1~~TRINITY_DN7197_c0_g1_i17.p2  ORF type:complete len:135 (-),score=34.80 TRINITY_DN7197_c0_g1_i17:363-767(-)